MKRCDGQGLMKERGQGEIGAHDAGRRQFKMGEGASCCRSNRLFNGMRG